MLNFPQIEQNILKYWDKKKIFDKSLKKKSPQGDFVFYDGPPFATGSPHYGHIVASLMKDVVPRYWTMKGYYVERRWGWDCHGLPIENIVEKEMNLNSRKDIEKIGIDKFNEACRSKVLLYVEEWREVIHRLGRWVDMDNDYKTMDKNFMESVWWVFKQLWDKGLIYEGYRTMHICPRCETTLSQSEVSEGYKDVKDLAVTIKFELEDEPNTFILAWTTTPWTLPGNTALALGEDIDYVKVKSKISKEIFIIGKAYFNNNQNLFGQVLDEFKGRKLIGKKYKPLFDYYLDKNLENKENLYTIQMADFVTIEDGTGVVHIAPAFGEEDMNLGKEKRLVFIQHVKMDGRFTDEVKDFAGQEVRPKDDHQRTDKKIIEFLKKKNLLFSQEEYEHSYPHCWRCETPLLNYATSSLFVSVTKIKKQLLENARDINWVPEHIKEGRFGKWLEGAKDWSISRQRFWGSVIPIWICQKCGEKKVFGSIKELEKVSGQKIKDLHKHFVDKIELKCQKCFGLMKRTPDVLDCWFESGSMPYAQMHYPFENKEKFESNFPAQFIAEGVDQTRAWFYYLHVLATALKNSAAFKNVIVNGIVLNEEGKKMAKRLQNYPDPMEVMKKYGADALRYYLISSPVMKAEDLNFSENDLKEQMRFLNTLINVLIFYKTFAKDIKIGNLKENNLINVLDKWIIAKLEVFKKNITNKMDQYDLNSIREIPDFVNELSTWYIRRSRDKFKSENQQDKIKALKILRHVLFHLSRIMAPFMPFMAEYIYQELRGKKESVHLEDWPAINEKVIDLKIIEQMDLVRKICELGHKLRAEAGIKVRQPLASLKIKNQIFHAYRQAEKIKNKELLDLIKEELNVKEVIFDPAIQNEVELDTRITPELKEEGILRELIRQINSLRKEAKLTIKDKINLYYQTDFSDLKNIFQKFAENIKKETISKELVEGENKKAKISKEIKINGQKITLSLC